MLKEHFYELIALMYLTTFSLMQVRTVHSRWQAFRGESTDSRDLLFNAKTHSVLYLKTKLDVFLAHNTTEEVCDFKVEGSWFERSCVIYAGDSSTVIAKVRYSLHMHKKPLLIGKI